jgi:hypothetical protein
MSWDASAKALHALSQFVIAKTSMGDTLLRVSEATLDALPAAEMAGISLMGDDGRPTTGIFTDNQAPGSLAPAPASTAGGRARPSASTTWRARRQHIPSS